MSPPRILNSARRLRGADEDGAILIFTMLGLTVLLAMSALVIDLGFGYVVDRRASAAADHAVLAAAFTSCSGGNVNAAADVAVVNNGFQTSDLTLVNTAPDTYRATVATDVDTFFGRVVGIQSINVAATAVASCTVSSGGQYAIFAGGNNCGAFGKQELDISGSNQEVFGGVHSNGLISIGGSTNDFGPGDPGVDPVTYVSSFSDGGSGNVYDPGYPSSVPHISTWPISFDRAHYETLSKNGDPQHHYVNGDIDGSYIETHGDGLYYATGKIQMDKTVDLDVTLVAEDYVDVSGSSQTLNPFVDDLLFFGAVNYSGIDRCDKQGVKMAGSDNEWNGYIYAPQSQVEFSGSSNTSVKGSIVSWSVKLNGSTVNLTSDGNSGSGLPDVSLLE